MMVRLKTLPDEPRGGAWRSSVRGVNSPVKSGMLSCDSMKTMLKPKICYMVGLFSKSLGENNAIGIRTNLKDVEERFIEIAVKELSIEPSKILFRDRDVFFYHSRIYKQFLDIVKREARIFRTENELSKSYVAGLFDGAGSIKRSGVYIKGMNPSDELMLEELGIHTNGGRVLNISKFFMLINGYSILLEITRLPGYERDSH